MRLLVQRIVCYAEMTFLTVKFCTQFFFFLRISKIFKFSCLRYCVLRNYFAHNNMIIFNPKNWTIPTYPTDNNGRGREDDMTKQLGNFDGHGKLLYLFYFPSAFWLPPLFHSFIHSQTKSVIIQIHTSIYSFIHMVPL